MHGAATDVALTRPKPNPRCPAPLSSDSPRVHCLSMSRYQSADEQREGGWPAVQRLLEYAVGAHDRRQPVRTADACGWAMRRRCRRRRHCRRRRRLLPLPCRSAAQILLRLCPHVYAA